MYAQLGNIRFEGLKGFSSFDENSGVEYAQHSRINRKPRLESTGDLLDTISFEMYLHSSFSDPETDIEALRSAMVGRQVLPLVLGNGNFAGNFVIASLNKKPLFTDPNGNYIEITVAVELLEFHSDDPLLDAQRQAIKDSFATSARSSNVRSVLPAKMSPGMTVTDSIGDIQTQGVRVNQYTAAAEAKPSTFKYYSGQINKTLDNMEDSVQTVQDKLSDSQDLLDLATTLPTAMQEIYTNIQNMKAVFPITDIESFKILNRQLQGSILKAKTANVKISNQSVIRRK